jgi:nicotinate-nucleotide pyrophosphorylase (carboxylating)
MGVASEQIHGIIALALEEDLGAGDVTSIATIPADLPALATIVAKAPGVVAGLPVVEAVFAQLDPSVSVTLLAADGDRIAQTPMELARIEGPARSVLGGERTALNILGHLCGVATATRAYVDRVEGTGARILDTRKTLPGLRVLDKYAVICGGGVNHRVGLYDAILIKDNHLRVAGGVRPAVESARALYPALNLTVEVEHEDQLNDAIQCGAQRIMLDNMSPDRMRAAVELIAGRAEVEASGGITLGNVREVAETGVDVISIGAITHSAKWLDVSLEVQ